MLLIRAIIILLKRKRNNKDHTGNGLSPFPVLSFCCEKNSTRPQSIFCGTFPFHLKTIKDSSVQLPFRFDQFRSHSIPSHFCSEVVRSVPFLLDRCLSFSFQLLMKLSSSVIQSFPFRLTSNVVESYLFLVPSRQLKVVQFTSVPCQIECFLLEYFRAFQLSSFSHLVTGFELQYHPPHSLSGLFKLTLVNSSPLPFACSLFCAVPLPVMYSGFFYMPFQLTSLAFRAVPTSSSLRLVRDCAVPSLGRSNRFRINQSAINSVSSECISL